MPKSCSGELVVGSERINSETEFVILASSGVWEVISYFTFLDSSISADRILHLPRVYQKHGARFTFDAITFAGDEASRGCEPDKAHTRPTGSCCMLGKGGFSKNEQKQHLLLNHTV